MEGKNFFDVDGLLTQEEAADFFSQQEDDEGTASGSGTGEEEESHKESEIDNENADAERQERVGKENNEKRGDVASEADNGSSSPNVLYSSIARVAKKDGIFSNLDDEFIDKIKGAEDFGEALEQEITARLDEEQKRIKEFKDAGATPQEMKQSDAIKNTLDTLQGISQEDIVAEDEEGEKLRRRILYNYFLSKGYDETRAKRELKKSFDANMEVEDAKDALVELTKYYETMYNDFQNGIKKRHDDMVAQQKKNAEDFRKMVLDEEIALGDQKLSKAVRQQIYDATQKPTYKDPETGRLLTEVQRYQKENPLEFLKQVGMWLVLTNYGKDMVGFTKDKVKSEKHKAMRELETKILANNNDGSLRYIGSSNDNDDNDLLLSDNWK